MSFFFIIFFFLSCYKFCSGFITYDWKTKEATRTGSCRKGRLQLINKPLKSILIKARPIILFVGLRKCCVPFASTEACVSLMSPSRVVGFIYSTDQWLYKFLLLLLAAHVNLISNSWSVLWIYFSYYSSTEETEMCRIVIRHNVINFSPTTKSGHVIIKCVLFIYSSWFKIPLGICSRRWEDSTKWTLQK